MSFNHRQKKKKSRLREHFSEKSKPVKLNKSKKQSSPNLKVSRNNKSEVIF